MWPDETSEAPSNHRKYRGVIFIEPEHCKACGFCIELCPEQVLGFSSSFNSKGYHPVAVLRPDSCTGGNHCGAICPDFAIFARRQRVPKASP
jgi:2-oxoglutarate ferredoxin oxidoreductase subunit delta